MDLTPLDKKLVALIGTLGGNSAAAAYYQKVRDKLSILKTVVELREFLNSICSSAKIKDAHGLTLEQAKVWDEMWQVADDLRRNI